MSLSEAEYLRLADVEFRAVEDACEELDPDDVEAVPSGDVLALVFRDGSRCVINTQRPARQLWVAALGRGWHLDFDPARGRWVDDRGSGEEFRALVSRIVRESSGIELAWG